MTKLRTKPTDRPPAADWETLILAAADGAEPPEDQQQQAGRSEWSGAALERLCELKQLLGMQGKVTPLAVLQATLGKLKQLAEQQRAEQVAASAQPATMESFQVLASRVARLHRSHVIAHARADYTSEPRLSRLCHEAAFVSQALRDAGHAPLADGELK